MVDLETIGTIFSEILTNLPLEREDYDTKESLCSFR